MAYSASEVDLLLADNGSISALKAIHPDQIADPELSFFWGLAKNRLADFEKAEDEVVRILDRRHAKEWKE